MIIKKGTTRIVIIFKTSVIKIPNFSYSWTNFITGVLANIRERDTWRWNMSRPEILELLAPVLWCSWGALILVMKKADVEGYEQYIRSLPETDLDYREQRLLDYKKWIDAGLGGDDKPDNYGYLEGRLVKIDYH